MSPGVALIILKLIDLLAAGLKLTPELRRQKETYISQIRKMIEEDRGPTDEELEALIAEGDYLTNLIRAERVARGD